jgi:L,D-peptidoglycan transpeptidase YkuD (ErfK/YbiS/YcfS/YnhG family)
LTVLLQQSLTTVEWKSETLICSVGFNGFVEEDKKQEGDKKTPIGRFSFMYGYYRPDRTSKPNSPLPFYEITKDLCWCDDPKSPHYNQPFNLNDARRSNISSFEHMWRDDALYDIVVVVSHNQNPVIPFKGSAIFIHCTNGEDTPYKPSLGCLKLKQPDLLKILLTAETDTIWDTIEIWEKGYTSL